MATPEDQVQGNLDAIFRERGIVPGEDAPIPGVASEGDNLQQIFEQNGIVETKTLDDLEAPEPERTLAQKIAGRFTGSDVDDPQETARLAGTVIGGLVGGHMGSQVPRPPGPLGIVVNPVTGAAFFGLVGTVLGAAAPEATMFHAESAGLLPEGTLAKSGLSPDELRTVMEGEALLDMATLGGLTAVRLTGRGFIHLFAGIGKGGKELTREAAERGIALMPVQVGEREISRGYVAVLGRFPFLGGPIRKQGQKVADQAAAAFDETIDRVGTVGGWNEVSEIIFADADELLKRTNKIFGDAYDDIFRRADELGVEVIPVAVTKRAEEMLAAIKGRTPATAEGAESAGEALDDLAEFLEKEILSIRGATESGIQFHAKQSMQQMDGLLQKIDQKIAATEPGQQRFVRSQLTQIRQAAKLDMLHNLSARTGADGQAIAHEINALDKNFSHVMSQLFETTAANRFGSVQKRGLRSVGFNQTTRTPVDELSRIVVRMDSPQVIEELSRLVSTDTMQRITAKTLKDAVDRAVLAGDGKLNISAYNKALGLADETSPRAQTIKTMLEKSGSDLKFEDLQKISEALGRIADTDIPNVSSFVARRATLGGFRAAISALVPTMVMTSGAVSFGMGSLLSAATVVGGTRLMSNMLANPRNARFLLDVLDEEATSLVRKKAFVQSLRFGVQSMRDAGEITVQEAANMDKAASMLMIEIVNQTEQLIDEGIQNE